MDSCCNSESLETIVEQAIHLSSTDIHLQCGQPIYLRHGDGLKATSFVCTTDLIEDILRRCGIAPTNGNPLMKHALVVVCAFAFIYIGLIKPYVVPCAYSVINNFR